MNHVRDMRKMKGLTMKQLADLCEVSESQISNIEKEKRKPSFELMLKLGEALECPVGELFFDLSEFLRQEPEREESALERKYNALDAHGKAVVDSVLDLELKRCTGPVKAPGRIIPLFPAAAGPEDLAEGEPFESYETDNDKADFAVRISGDSMEPHFKNGEVVLCQKRVPNDGDIAVMSVNGAIVVKQYISAYGNIYLRSLNRARKNLDIDILESGNYTVVGYGTVICAKIPLVTQ